MAQAESPFEDDHPRILHSSLDCLCWAFSNLTHCSAILFVQNKNSDSWCSLLCHPTFSPGPVLSEQTQLQWWCRNAWNLSDLFPGNISPWHGQWTRTFFWVRTFSFTLRRSWSPSSTWAPLFSGFASDARTFMKLLWNIYGSGVRQGVMADGSSHPLPCPQSGKRLTGASILLCQIFEVLRWWEIQVI